MQYEMFEDRSGMWRWNLDDAKGSTIATSARGYVDPLDCLHAINLVRSSRDAAVAGVTLDLLGRAKVED